ncbi:proline-rich protein 19 [Pagrus major]|uniref:proline-rich protein 19 n=1 Tax=Pagrus major TaxID=143350 RepID=UPI003CC89EBA
MLPSNDTFYMQQRRDCGQLRIQCNMSRICGTLPDKGKPLNVFNRQLKTTDKNCCSVNTSTADCKCFNPHSTTDGQHKMKRLKSRKERSQMRGGGKEASKFKSYHHHCRRQTSKDMVHRHNCCHSSSYCPSRRDARFPNVVPTSQEPSIITDSRLIGHQGLFNHEVKSIDIERLLSKQKKDSNPSLTSHIPSPLSTNDLLGADTGEVMPSENKAGPATKANDDCLEKEKKFSQGSDLTPGQRPKQKLGISSGSFKTINSSKQLAPTVNTENVNALNKKEEGHMVSTLEHTPKNSESPVHQTQAHHVCQSPVQLSSSPTADSFDIQHRRLDPDSVFKSVSAVAASLCDCLQFPLLTGRSLVTECREALLKALQERHGPHLKGNLLKVQRCLSFGANPAKEVQDQQPTMVDENELFPTGAFPTAFQADNGSQPRFDKHKTTSFKQMRSRHFNCKSSPQLHHNLRQTAEWLTSPGETSVGLSDDILRPSRSPQFCMDFEPSGVSATDHLFAPSSTSCWREKASESQCWEDRIDRPQTKEPVVFGSFENSFMNHTRVAAGRSGRFQYSDTNTQPFIPYQAQLQDRRLADPVYFPPDQDPFEIDRYSFAPSFSAQTYHPQQLNHFQPFSQFSHPPACLPLRPHHTDMMHYPPSHMLDRDPAPPLSSLPSPEHWSFPPMRLY